MKSTDKPVIVEQIFNVPAEKLWKALTNLSEMKKWYFDNIPEFTPEVGFKTSFVIKTVNRTFTHRWEITEVVPLKKIKYRWNYLEYPGDGFVCFEISEAAHGTILKLTNKVTKDFPAEIPEFRWKSCYDGWNYFIKHRLKEYLEKK